MILYNVLFTPNRRYICGHDDFSIIYVCADMCAPRRQCFAKDFVSGGGGKLRVLNVTL